MPQRLTAILLCAATALILTPGPSSAQDDRRIHVNLGGGPTFVLGDMGTHFATGWGPEVGVSLEGGEKKIALQFDYGYRFFDVKSTAPLAGATTFSANHQAHQLGLSLVLNLTPADSAVRAYVLAGPAVDYRKVEILQYVGTGVICDPYYYVCGSYSSSGVVGSRGGWDLGFNAGGGLGFRLGEKAEIYVETRYHHVWGPDIVSATALPAGTGTGGKADASFWPVTLGLRF